MNIGKNDVKRIKRIFQKYKVSFEFVLLNFSKVIQLYKYVTGRHIVIKRKLVKKKDKVVIKYNTLRKSLFSLENKKKRRNCLPWSTRAVQFIKRQRILEKNQDEIENVVGIQSDSLSPDEIQKKLKEQLELLKSGKKTVPLIGGQDDELIKTGKIAVRNINSLRHTNEACDETRQGNAELECNDELENIIYSQHVKDNNEKLLILPDYAEESNGTQSSPDEDPLYTDTSPNMPFTKSMKFLDLLINKMQIADTKKKSKSMYVTNAAIQQIDETSQNPQNLPNNNEFKNQLNKDSLLECSNDIESMDYSNYEEGENIFNIEVNVIPPTIDKDNENVATTATAGEETSSSSSEFLGFTDYEIVPSTVPGMLPTPVVAKSKTDSQKSAFISEDLDNFLRENSLQGAVSSSRVEVPKRRYKGCEEGLMCDGATPPKMIMPVIPEELSKPRTVAEKRYVLQRKQSIKYYMIENENTIYRELKKRTKYGKANTTVVRCIQNLEVPCTRDCWKASAWLCTENGRFYFQMLKVDDVIVKLVGGSGNHITKYKPPQLSRPPKKLLPKVCSPSCRQNVDFRNIIINLSDDETEFQKKEKIENDFKLQIGSVDEKPALKPGPLSSKCMFSPFHPNMGELQVYEMPKVKLEVFPEVDKPLDDAVKPYLKYILPSNCITREWAEFAVSTVILKKELIEKEHPKSFTFTIPYLNNQNNILVRKMYNRKEKMEKFSTKDFEFRNEVQADDEIASECADILSEMINSVAIGLSEDSLLKDDPDIDYSNNTRVNEETVRRDSGEEKISEVSEKRTTRTKKDKLVMELKKLNATVIDAESFYSVESKRCKIPHCRYGCVCQSISGKPIQRKYCKKNECMLLSGPCKHMTSTDIGDLMNSSLTTENALLIRRKATEKLAKVEKEFCATVVLTDKETFVLNEPTKERKRSKRIPKRFDDYDTTEGTESNAGNNDEEPIPKLYPFDDEPPPKKFKHCTVDLYKLEGLEYIEPWCMIHCLYKCFCKGESTTGVPFEIKKEETIVSQEIAYPRRPIYSFDKETPSNTKNSSNSEQSLLKRRNDSVASNDRYDSPSKIQKTDVDTSICRRIMPVPVNMYQFENRRRATKVRRTIRMSENDSTRFMLSNKIQNSLQFPTTLQNNRSLLKTNKSYKRRREDSDESTNETGYTPDIETNKNEDKFPVISSVCSLSEVPELNLKLHRQRSMPSETSSNSSGDISQFLKSGDKNAGTSGDYLTNTPETSSFINPLPANATKVNSQFHKQVINKLNLAVTQSMHSICTIQLSNTKKIPAPVPNTLSCHQWNLFLQAYVEGTIYIWEIRTNNGSFLAATVTNLMPVIPNALSVINIKAISKHKLPLVGKMLNARFINDKTKTLSVLLTGHHGHWRIIGFIHSTYDYLKKGGYFKPTPQSHPCLSKKINLLYNMMILRQIRSAKMLVGQKAPATITSQQHASEIELDSSEKNTRHNESRSEKNISENINSPELYTITSPVPSIAVPETYAEESVTQLNISENRTISESCASTSSNMSSPVPSIAVLENSALVQGSDKSSERKAFKMDRETVGLPFTPKCNLEIKRVSYKTIEGIVIPLAIPGDHRWLVLDIVCDFSHIYIPDWKNFLSYDKIKKAITLTQRTRKIVRIGQDQSTIDVFATPDIRDRIYLGPYAIDAEEDIVLYQNIDGRMMLREDFEKSHNISKEQRTCGFWLYKKFGKLIFDIDLKSLHISKVPLDDDCVIVDDKGNTVSEEAENVYAIIKDKAEESFQKLDVAQQPVKSDLPFQIDLDSVRTLHESDSEKEKKSEISKATPLLKPLHVTTMQVAKISTKRGVNNLKIIKNIDAPSVPEKITSSDKLETEITGSANELLISQTDLTKEMDQSDPVVQKPKDLQVSDVSQEKKQHHPIVPKPKDQVSDISILKEKDQSQLIDPKPKDLQICDVSISPILENSSDTKCYGPMTASKDSEAESVNTKFRGTLVSSISKHSGGTKCYGPTPESQEGEQQNGTRRKSLSLPVSLLIQAMKPPPSIITKKTGSPTIPLIHKIQSKSGLAAKLVSVNPAQIATPTSNAALIGSQRSTNLVPTIITKATSPVKSISSVIKPGSSPNPQSPANAETLNTKMQTLPKTIFLNIPKADAQIASEGSNHRELTVTASNLDGIRTVNVTNVGDKNKMVEADDQPLCGYVVCEDSEFGPFPAKRLGDFYFLKMPATKGVYRLKGIDMVNRYLNCHIRKQLPSAENKCWKFSTFKDLKREKTPIVKIDKKILGGVSKKPEATSTITSTTQQEGLSRKYVLTLAKNTNVLHQKAVPDSLTLETESKLQKLKNFTVKKTAIIKDPRFSVLAKEKWIKVKETPVETVTTINPNSLLRKVLSLPAKLPPVPAPEKTATLLTPPKVKTPPPVTRRTSLPANSKTPPAENVKTPPSTITKLPLSVTVTPPVRVPVTKPLSSAVTKPLSSVVKTPPPYTVSLKPFRPLLPISIKPVKPACDEVILIDDDE